MTDLVTRARVRAKMLVGKSDEGIVLSGSAPMTSDLLVELADQLEDMHRRMQTLQDRHNRLQHMHNRLKTSNANYSTQVRALKRSYKEKGNFR